MEKPKQQQKMFMVREIGKSTPTSTACHVAAGAAALSDTVTSVLGKLSRSSKDALRALVEEEQPKVLEQFKGKTAISLYNEAESARVEVYLVMDSRGLA